jgi:putative ABC transport system ATP-binding protein
LTDRTILENVALSADIAGLPSRMARKNALEACAKYRLTQVMSRYPDRVSEVERRTALLARAEAAHKDLIVADSPADGLDQKSAGYIHERLAALRLAGITILYLTSGSGPENGPDQYLRLSEGRAES